jgi:hypothetical protein
VRKLDFVVRELSSVKKLNFSVRDEISDFQSRVGDLESLKSSDDGQGSVLSNLCERQNSVSREF